MPNQTTEPTAVNNQQNQTQTQTQAQNNQTTASQFDPSTLSPEALAWVDRQRTQASQTARANARKDLMRDDSFLNEIKQGLKPQVQQSVEDTMQEQVNNITKRLSVSEVSRVLEKGGIPQEQMSLYVDMFAGSDIDQSVQRATDFVSALNKTLQTKMEAKQVQAVQNMTTPQSSATSVTEQQVLQNQLDAARKEPNFREREVRMAYIRRVAQEKGITLK